VNYTRLTQDPTRGEEKKPKKGNLGGKERARKPTGAHRNLGNIVVGVGGKKKKCFGARGLIIIEKSKGRERKKQ